MTKKIKGKKVAAYRVAANAFNLLNSCPDLLTAVLNDHSKDMSEEAHRDFSDAIHMLRLVVYQVYKTSIEPANTNIETSSTSNAIGGRYPGSELLNSGQLYAAADAYAASGGVIIKGWKTGKGGMLEHLRRLYPQHHKIKRWDQVTPRLENAGTTEDKIRDRIANWKPNKSR